MQPVHLEAEGNIKGESVYLGKTSVGDFDVGIKGLVTATSPRSPASERAQFLGGEVKLNGRRRVPSSILILI